jgi:hypothetical protein
MPWFNQNQQWLLLNPNHVESQTFSAAWGFGRNKISSFHLYVDKGLIIFITIDSYTLGDCDASNKKKLVQFDNSQQPVSPSKRDKNKTQGGKTRKLSS